MEDITVTLPVHCPVCGQGLNMPLKRSEVLDAIRNRKPIRVYSSCHDATWDLDALSRQDLAIMARAFDP